MIKSSISIWIALAAMLITACSPFAAFENPLEQAPLVTEPAPTQNAGDPEAFASPEPEETMQTTESISPTSTPFEDENPLPIRALLEFKTDFSKHSVPLGELISGGPPRDGIPPVDDPKFISVEEAGEWLKPVEPVILVQVGEDARAYPLQILTYHEIVNDTVGGLPLAVTFCPLCNTAIVFERTVDGRTLDFGTTGHLRFSNLLMYDRQTETWWQQGNGEAIVGELLGARLAFYPGAIISWEEFHNGFPSGKVLSRETGFSRPYGSNPYIGYDDVNNTPFLYRGPATPGLLPPVARVLTVDLDGEAVAYPYEVLEEKQVVNDSVGGEDILVIWQPGTASALDSVSIAEGRDVGAANAYSRQVDGQLLTFSFEDNKIIDDQTSSEWNFLGLAVSGDLDGKQLEPIVAINHFWFSWAAFKPETRIYQP
jgi:hypothetical protein